jgi:hypothetical protein
MGHKHGIARGTAVFRTAGCRDTELPPGFHSSYVRLQAWSGDRGLVLDESPESLSRLDERLNAWHADPTHYDSVDLANEGGAYLGAVIIRHIKGARWKMFPNGHPVVLLPNGKSVDVTRLANDRLNHAGLALDAILSKARSS